MIDERMKNLFATMLQVTPDQVDDKTRPGDVARWDSLQHMILVSAFEEEFDVDVEPEEAVEMYRDFGAFKNAILTKVRT
jgi:acyl carrier protein